MRPYQSMALGGILDGAIGLASVSGPRRAFVAAGLLALLVACGGSDPHFLSIPGDDASTPKPTKDSAKGAGDEGSSDSGTGAPSDAGDGGTTLTDPDGGTLALTCADIDCGLHGDCSEDAMTGLPACQCDKGYMDRSSTCVEDKKCLELRLNDCRSEYGASGSAIGMTVSVAYCSGNPYTGLRRGDLLVEEMGEDAFEPLLQSESLVTIVDRKYVHHVFVVADVSQSVRDSKVLDDVAKGIDHLFAALEKLPDDFRVAVYLFDGKPYLHEPSFIPETGDLAAARAAVGGLPFAPGLDARSTNLYGSVIRALQKVERSLKLKELVDQRGVLSTASVIVVSDGDDEAALRSFGDAKAAIDATATRVVTVGLGDEANFPKLTSLGRDGSFAAATPDKVVKAFEDIGAEFANAAASLYFVAYCSPKRAGEANARVSIKGFKAAPVECKFDAAVFSSGCNADLFVPSKVCAGRQCGELIGCGDCPIGQCCVADQCVAPAFNVTDDPCGTEWMCQGPLSCLPDTMAGHDTCQVPVIVSGDCNPEVCNPGESFCEGMTADTSTCVAAKPVGQDCMAKDECLSRHCGSDPDFPAASSLVCLAPLQMFEACDMSGACEPGSWCKAGTCSPQLRQGVACMANEECMSGDCKMALAGTKRCTFAPLCYFGFTP